MKKKEDLKKHLSGEKSGLKAEHCKNSIIIFILLFYDLSYSQIPIDGFCALETHIVPQSYNGLLAADINLDGTDELILYSNSLKQVGIFFPGAEIENQFIEFSTASEISQLKKFKDKEDHEGLFVSVERKLRKVSLIYLSEDELLENKGEIIFDSFPENVHCSDLDLNGTDEIIVSGSGFDGISILTKDGEIINERKILNGTSFSEAVFVDLNSDQYPDILAFNILENSLQFFYNNTLGEFRLERSLNYPVKLNLIRTRDFDKDGFNDIIFSSGTSIEILFGDFQSGFERTSTTRLMFKPDGFLFGNFNRDEIMDLTYYNSESGKLNLLFGSKENGFYEGITYLQQPMLSSISEFNYNESASLACLSESGGLYFISTLKEFNRDLKIIPALHPGAIKQFDYSNNGITDISFIDGSDNSLKIFLSDKKGIPSFYYSIPLSENHTEIAVDEFFKKRKSFYCYTKGKPLIELFTINLPANKLDRKQLYAPGEILDLSLKHVDSSLVNVFLLYNKKSKLYLGKFDNRDLSITFREYPFIDRNVSDAELILNNNPEVYYWKTEGDFFYFNLAEMKMGPINYKNYFQIGKSEDMEVKLFGSDNYDSESPGLVGLVQKENNNYALVLDNNNLKVLSQSTDSNTNGKKIFSHGFFGESSLKGVINFTVNSKDDNSINRLIINGDGKYYEFTPMLAAENVSDYFIARLDQKKYYLIYSNKVEGCLSVKSLSR